MKNKIATAIYEASAFKMVQDAKTNLDNQGMSILTSGIKERDMNCVIAAQIENYLNALDYACSLYFSHDINQLRFLLMYKTDVQHIFETDAYKDHANLNTFINLGLFYKLIKAGDQVGKNAKVFNPYEAETKPL